MSPFPLIRSLSIAAVVFGFGGRQAVAQQPTSQQHSHSYYGLPEKQPPTPSIQGSITCYPNPNCQPDKVGCTVTICPCPCQSATNCIPNVPDIHRPSCQNPCVLISELPPATPPRTIDIYRNCYVPIKIDYRHPDPDVTPVNINVRWREVHFLCGPDGQPLSSEQAAAVLKELQAQVAANGNAAPPEGAPITLPAPTSDLAVSAGGNAPPPEGALITLPAPAPSGRAVSASANGPVANGPVAAQADNRNYQWIYVTTANKYGYGYINEAGFAVVDPNSLRDTPPPANAASASNDSATGVTLAASNGQ